MISSLKEKKKDNENKQKLTMRNKGNNLIKNNRAGNSIFFVYEKKDSKEIVVIVH